MLFNTQAWIAIDLALVALVFPAAVCAQGAGGNAAARPAVGHTVNGQLHRLSEYRFEADGGTSGLAVTGRRRREGRRHHCELADCSSWSREYSGSAQGWVEIAPGLALTTDYTISRTRFGNPDAAVLSQPSGGTSQSLSVGMRGPNAAVSLTAFDRAGWSSPDIADFARRTANGESRARRGVAADYQTERVVAGIQSRLGLTVERADNPGGQMENSARVTLRGRI